MTATFHETDELRKWLADYLFTEIVCNPNEIDMNLSLNDLGVGSRDAVVLSGQLAELIGLPVSPGGLRGHPTINDLVNFLAGPQLVATRMG
jgi:phthiocerol/phenolphthiocerol synthesis type-I polyketide synthase B